MTKLPCQHKPEKVEMWVDEDIWGHRLYDEQTPWMTFLEFLGVLQSELRKNSAFQEAQPNKLNYKSYTRLHLRNILFNNPRLEAILAEYPDDRSRWENWLANIKNDSGGINPLPDYSYLKSRFSSFEQFALVVSFLQANSIEGDSNKRWSSKFVFPYGPHCLYVDLSATGTTNDRRFFARTGELLYLMMCRSGRGKDLLSNLEKLGLVSREEQSYDHPNRLDRIVAALQPERDLTDTKDGGSPPYLPYPSLPEYENLADDWLILFAYGMPNYDVLPHLVTITGLHQIIYLLGRAQDELGEAGKPEFILEIVSPRKTVVRELASTSYLQNNLRPQRAIEKHIQNATQTAEWQASFDSSDSYGDALKVLQRHFDWPESEDDEDVSKCRTPEDLLERLQEKAATRHKQHFGKCHGNWAKEIGLASSRGSKRTRYAPTDSLLKTLVLSTVTNRMEFQKFLAELYKKYGFIVSDAQAKEIIASGQADQEAFAENGVRLEQRLASMGLLKRLSDACAYVQNPFAEEERDK